MTATETEKVEPEYMEITLTIVMVLPPQDRSGE
jgi:hypothetical protein